MSTVNPRYNLERHGNYTYFRIEKNENVLHLILFGTALTYEAIAGPIEIIHPRLQPKTRPSLTVTINDSPTVYYKPKLARNDTYMGHASVVFRNNHSGITMDT